MQSSSDSASSAEASASFQVIFHAGRPELREQRHQTAGAWAEFMYHDAIANEYWDNLYSDFPEYQFYVLDTAGKMVAEGNTIPFFSEQVPDMLPDAGWDAAMTAGMTGLASGIKPNTLSALAATIAPSAQGQGISPLILRTMKALARQNGLDALVAPVRPSLKHRYPLTPMEQYITWTHDDTGAPFDPWLRTHWRQGAKIIKVAPRSMRISGTVQDWQDWTQMRFPSSGHYIVPSALVPVEIDLERDEGVYIEPNVWMQHDLNRA